jgi:deoxycytidine triphosphate deaminase
MPRLSGNKCLESISGIIYARKQVHSDSVDLTVKRIIKLQSAGELDFGGSEYKAADTDAVAPVKKSPDDEYSWWNLEHGFYLVSFNEKFNLAKDVLGIIFPHSRLIRSGGIHSPSIVSKDEDPPVILLQVGPHGLRLKENARISSLIVMA